MSRYVNKLVRDKIPSIILNNGGRCLFEVLNESDYITQLNLKLIEECHEFVDAKSDNCRIEELADILEVVYSIANNLGIKVDHLEMIRMNKRLKNGGFDSRIFLKEVLNDN